MAGVETFVLEPQRARRVMVMRSAMLLTVFAVLIAKGLGAANPWLWTAIAVPAILLADHLYKRWRAPRVSVGVDGVLLAAQAGTRFVLHEAIEEITYEAAEKLKEPSHINLGLVSGETVTIPIACEVTETTGAALLKALRQHHRRASEPLELPEGLARDDREPSAWLEALRAIGRQGYRTRAVDADALTRALDEPLPAGMRVAAAIVLGEVDPAKARGRLRVAALDYARPETQRALLRIADATDDERAEAFAELAADEEARAER